MNGFVVKNTTMYDLKRIYILKTKKTTCFDVHGHHQVLSQPGDGHVWPKHVAFSVFRIYIFFRSYIFVFFDY